jgi:hypothetical protein
MTDLVSLLERYATEEDIYFSYGNRANNNLLQSDLDADRIYLLLDPLRRLKRFSEYGGTREIVFNSSFFLVKKSTIDQVYYNPNENSRFVSSITSMPSGFITDQPCFNYTQGKYAQHIKPLLEQIIEKIEGKINCSEYEILNWEILDAINVFDTNLDGLLVTFQLSKL